MTWGTLVIAEKDKQSRREVGEKKPSTETNATSLIPIEMDTSSGCLFIIENYFFKKIQIC